MQTNFSQCENQRPGALSVPLTAHFDPRRGPEPADSVGVVNDFTTKDWKSVSQL
jgi:hypothetical protein